MRILVVSSSFFPKIDGSVRVVYDLSRKLVHRGHEVYLLTRRFPDTPAFENFDGINVVRVGPARSSTVNRILLCLNQMIRLVWLLEEREFDVIHSHGCVPAFVGLVGKVLKRIPLVVTFHGHEVLWPESFRWKRKIALRLQLWLEHVVLRRVDVLVAQSMQIRKLFTVLYGSWICAKVRVIPNGVDLDEFMIETCNEEKLQNSAPLVLAVGTLSKIKGFDVLIKAMAIVSRVEPDARLVIVGGGPQRRVLERLAERVRVKDSVIFTGWLDRKKLYDCYCAADVVVLPTRAEFFPLVLLEGMAMAKPVISTKVMGPTELVVDGVNGFLVEPDNPMQLAEAIEKVILNEKLAVEMGEKGRKIVEEKYSLDKIVKQYEKIYQFLAN